MARDTFALETPHHKVRITYNDITNAYSVFIGHRWKEVGRHLWNETLIEEEDGLSEEDILRYLGGMKDQEETKEGYFEIQDWLIKNMDEYMIEKGED